MGRLAKESSRRGAASGSLAETGGSPVLPGDWRRGSAALPSAGRDERINLSLLKVVPCRGHAPQLGNDLRERFEKVVDVLIRIIFAQ